MEPQVESNVHPETLNQKEPEIVGNIAFGVTSLLVNYGWHFILLGAVALFAWHTWLKHKYETWRIEKEEREYDARYHKNPDIGKSRQEAIEAARKKQQEELTRASSLQVEIDKEIEEQKRVEKAAERQRLNAEQPGRRLGNSLDSDNAEALANAKIMKKGRAFKEDYNPLDGGGSSRGYRPPTKGCPGGGCGRK
ncbi:selenoprotein S-like [Neocloeon triangulifer]|uniref:selenoprotein S-like n=1 Tax=Neocloeon triangulifer TaxID=2078957 RepID=UPI00286F63DC|nr:selenoprotein S-like [Neocloeon triangulifer]